MILLTNRTNESGKTKGNKKELAKCQKRREEKDFQENGRIPLEGTLSRTDGVVGSARSSAFGTTVGGEEQ